MRVHLCGHLLHSFHFHLLRIHLFIFFFFFQLAAARYRTRFWSILVSFYWCFTLPFLEIVDFFILLYIPT